jgi:hypothetical protein
MTKLIIFSLLGSLMTDQRQLLVHCKFAMSWKITKNDFSCALCSQSEESIEYLLVHPQP